MEINNYIDNSPIIGSDLSTLSSSMNIKALDSVNVVGEGSNSFSIEFNTQERRSDLSLSLRNMMEDISVSQVALQSLNEQSTILSNIQEMVSGDNQSLLEEIQPSVEELLSKYNYLSTDINKNFEKYQEETNSRNYFDGMLGSKPLNPAEIIKAVEQQQEVVKAEKKFFGDNVEKVADKALEVINIEIDKSNKEAPFKNIDFGKNTANFTSANINNVVGSVVSSQANAIPANSPKLLA